MRHRLRGFVVAGALFLVSPSLVFALEVPKHPEGYVSDYARVLSVSARARLEQALKDFDAQTGAQVLVATFPRLAGEALEPYSIRLAEAWKPGQTGKDNGAILVVFTEDRKVRIEVGYGLEGVLTDAACRRIIEDDIAPRFRAGDYDGGIERGVAAMLSAARGEDHSAPSTGQDSQRVVRSSIGPSLLLSVLMSQAFPTAALWLLFLAGVVGIMASVAVGRPIVSLYAVVLGVLPMALRALLPFVFASSSGLSGRGCYRGYGGGGFGGFGGGGFGGGGFSGGGGGFGGGGASGSW